MNLESIQTSDPYPTIHRDMSWLSFNARVMQEATDERNPLYERIKFLGIYSKNLKTLHIQLADNVKAREIDESGTNSYHSSQDAPIQSQHEIYQLRSVSKHLVKPAKVRSRQTL